jgi:hypothetical protein
MNQDRKLTSVDHRDGSKNRPERGARAKPMHEKDRENRGTHPVRDAVAMVDRRVDQAAVR